MTDFSLDGRIALITGASRGIGEAIAKTFAEKGARCILVSRKIDGLNKAAARIIEDGGTAEAMACHAGYMDQISELFENIGEKYGRLDILVNNAAINPHVGEMLTAEESHWDKIMDVNLKGPFFMIRKAVPLMEKSGGGAILNISSVNGITPAAMQGLYSISKAGIISMTRAFAKELVSRNIRVNALLPGPTYTRFSAPLLDNEEIRNYVLNQVPMNRPAQPDEMTGAALYLVSDASSFTTGACLPCDGGFLA